MGLPEKDMVEKLKVDWKRLWIERLDDKLRAEGVATADYCDLFVEKGTVIHATRDFKALSLREILKHYEIFNADRYIPPTPEIGGWRKFVKTNIATQQLRTKKKRADLYREEIKEKQQPKKGGRGWLHK